MLTTTLDGLWALQVLTGIESVAPELGLRPHLPSVESKVLALQHPIARELRDAGVVDASGTVDSTVVEWLTVLARRDIALYIQLRTPDRDESDTALLARFAQWWVAIERSADLIRISGAGTSSAEGSAGAVLERQIQRLCGQNAPAAVRPVTLDGDALRAASLDRDILNRFLARQELEPDQLKTLMLAADPDRSARASIVAIQNGVATGRTLRTHVEASAVTIIDTPAGRLVVEDVDSGKRKWMIVAPGTGNNIAAAITAMMRRLPAHQEWFSYRKVV